MAEQTKKAIALLGSKRKKNTYALLMQIREILAGHGIELEIVELYQYQIKDCIGCDRCVLKGKCVLQDDAAEIMQKLEDADGVVLATPVYLQQVSGKLKTFFDRTCCWYHRPVLTGKPILCVASTKGSGLRETLSYLQNIAAQWGGIPADKVGRTIFNEKEKISEKEIERFIKYLYHPETFSPSFSQLMGFEVQKALSQYLNQLDAAYWANMGWVDKPYFYPCRVNVFKSALTGTFGAFLRNRMSKNTPDIEDVSSSKEESHL